MLKVTPTTHSNVLVGTTNEFDGSFRAKSVRRKWRDIHRKGRNAASKHWITKHTYVTGNTSGIAYRHEKCASF